MRAGRPGGRKESGFTFVGALSAVALVGIALAAIGPRWADAVRREREQDLLRVGALYAQAIASYYQAAPGNQKTYPPTLEALVLDPRFVGTKRHLRRLYGDPLNASRPWGTVAAPGGGIRGVFSVSDEMPYRQSAVGIGTVALPAAHRYSDWKFIPEVER
jgi:type II secretory pathway pseudopilin PulG